MILLHTQKRFTNRFRTNCWCWRNIHNTYPPRCGYSCWFCHRHEQISLFLLSCSSSSSYSPPHALSLRPEVALEQMKTRLSYPRYLSSLYYYFRPLNRHRFRPNGTCKYVTFSRRGRPEITLHQRCTIFTVLIQSV